MAATHPISVRSERTTYSRVSIAFHWTIAALIAGSMTSGILHGYVDDATAARIMLIHKPAGITILALSFARVVWRLSERSPPPADVSYRWDRLLARFTHTMLYVLMLAVPLAGWAAASGHGALSYFGLFDVPSLPLTEAEASRAGDVHSFLALLMLGLMLLHIAGALKHHLVDKDDVLTRMAPMLKRRRANG